MWFTLIRVSKPLNCFHWHWAVFLWAHMFLLSTGFRTGIGEVDNLSPAELNFVHTHMHIHTHTHRVPLTISQIYGSGTLIYCGKECVIINVTKQFTVLLLLHNYKGELRYNINNIDYTDWKVGKCCNRKRSHTILCRINNWTNSKRTRNKHSIQSRTRKKGLNKL